MEDQENIFYFFIETCGRTTVRKRTPEVQPVRANAFHFVRAMVFSITKMDHCSMVGKWCLKTSLCFIYCSCVCWVPKELHFETHPPFVPSAQWHRGWFLGVVYFDLAPSRPFDLHGHTASEEQRLWWQVRNGGMPTTCALWPQDAEVQSHHGVAWLALLVDWILVSWTKWSESSTQLTTTWNIME